MNVLVACECSGAVRRAFRALGHNAYSADLLPSEDNSPHHFICDHDLHILHIIDQGCLIHGKLVPWDLLIAFPPCTFLCNSGVHLLFSNRPQEANRWQEMRQAALFFKALWDCPIPRIAIENPIMHKYAKSMIYLPSPAQTLQPYNFGHNASKRTCLWLKNLSPLRNSGPFIPPRITPDGRKRWANQTDSGQNKLPPSTHRSADRARTYTGIAHAMALQWGSLP